MKTFLSVSLFLLLAALWPAAFSPPARAASFGIKWDPNPSTEQVVGYRVYWADTLLVGQGTNAYAAFVFGPPYTLTNLNVGRTYTIQVSALNNINLESGLSSSYSYTVPSGPPLPTNAPPVNISTPTNVLLAALFPDGPGRYKISLKWDPVTQPTNILGYRARWGPDAAKTNFLKQVSTTTVQFAGLVHNQQYFFSIATVGPLGNESLPSPDYVYGVDLSVPGGLTSYTLDAAGRLRISPQ